MYPNRIFHWNDPAAVQSFVRSKAFGMLVVQGKGVPRISYIPFVLSDQGTILFHLARGNALAKTLNGSQALLVVNGPEGYISPDFYDLPDQVPTWNYIAVEISGSVRALDQSELLKQIDSLSEEQERRLLPKPVWTRHKMTCGLVEKMLKAIAGFEMTVTDMHATAKLNQNKPEAARLSAADHLERGGHTELARWMRNPPE